MADSVSDSFAPFAPGTLWQAIVERSRLALACGALRPIATENRPIVDHGVRFEIRVVSSLARKFADGVAHWPSDANANTVPNPFLPYENELFVADISDTHLCLLNKYNVIDHHVLIVTRGFEPQESPLTPADFEALWNCMREYNALGFYNSGPVAGASQPHKHLQLAPLPLSATGPDIPIEVLFDPAPKASELTRVARLPFAHTFAWLEPGPFVSPTVQAAYTHSLYHEMLAAAGFDVENLQLHPYNLLIARRFMLLIPRRRERFDNISVNSLGFAGSFLVSNQEGLEVIQRVGPMELLKQVSFADMAEI